MRLSKIYANKNFKNIEFVSDGLNVVLGEVLDKGNKNKDTHNLGKTSLISVIDFLLLKKSDKESFFNQNYEVFKEHVFYLELLLNNGKWLLVKRSVSSPTKISFKVSDAKVTGFPLSVDWDEDDVSFSKAKEKVAGIFDFDILQKHNYRAGLSYFLRNQYDYRDVFQLSKFIGKHKNWKPIIFDLLGFKGTLLLNKYELEDKKDSLIDAINQIKEQEVVDTKEADKLKGVLEIKYEELRTTEAEVDNFNFYNQDKKINEDLIEKIDGQISAYNSHRYTLTYEIDKISTALRNPLPTFDIKNIKELYEQVKVYFPDNLSKEYDDLQGFNLKISEERRKYLSVNLKEHEKELAEVEKLLLGLEEKRSGAVSVLKDKDTYEKFKYYQKQLAKTESEIARIEERLKSIEKVDGLETLISDKNKEIEKEVRLIREAVIKGNDFYKEIRKNFNLIVKEVLGSPAIISITLNNEGNVDFKAQMQNPEDLEVTAEGRGNTYGKLLCMAFDLSVLITYSKHSFYRFVYHDGCLEGLDDRKKLNFLALIRRICKAHGLEYILTVIDSDLPHDEFGELVAFSDKEVVLKLNDKDEQGTLFEKKF